MISMINTVNGGLPTEIAPARFAPDPAIDSQFQTER
jgi:hypothetical protein